MITNILYITTALAFIVCIAIGFKKLKFHVLYLALISSFIAYSVMYIANFLYYKQDTHLDNIIYGLLVLGFIVVPIQIRFTKDIKKMYQTVVIAAASSVLLMTMLIYPYIFLDDSNSYMYMDKMISNYIWILVLEFAVVSAVLVFLLKAAKTSMSSVSILVIISLLFSVLFRYNLSFDFFSEPSFEVESTSRFEQIHRIHIDGYYEIYGYFNNRFYFVDKNNNAPRLGVYNKGTWDAEYKTEYIEMLRNEQYEIYFHKGETYIGFDQSLYYLGNEGLEEIITVSEGNFSIGESFLEDDKLMIQTYLSAYQVEKGEVNYTTTSLIFDDYLIENNYSGSFKIACHNNVCVLLADGYIYYDGKEYPIAHGNEFTYYNGVLEFLGHYIYEGELYEKELYHDIITIEGRLYSTDYRVLVDLETGDRFNIKEGTGFREVDRVEFPIVIEDYSSPAFLGKPDLTYVDIYYFDGSLPYAHTIYGFSIWIIIAFFIDREIKKFLKEKY